MASDAKTFAAITSVTPPAGTPARFGTAVVLGGSMAGMLAARVLAEHAGTVLVVERDTPSGVDPRRGVPHSNQVHVLLAAGKNQLDRWFPGFTAAALDAGASIVTADRLASYSRGRRKVAGGELNLLSATRPFLESRVRAALAELPNVRTVTGRVTGLEFDDTAVTAVLLESGREPADLVVDAMGRSSNLSGWLEAAGWTRPRQTRVVTGVNYATAYFRRPPGDHPVLAALALAERDAFLAGANFAPVEGDRWIMMLAGVGENRPGSTTEEMVRLCREELPEPFGQVVANEVAGGVTTYRQADSRRRDFAVGERFPARLVAVGDAVASFNPIYGQGMSSAALHASCLSLFLRGDPDLDRPAREFFALQKVVVDAAWSVSTSGDRAEKLTRRARINRWLVQRVVAATVTDQQVNEVFQAVGQMLVHPRALARPRVILRALIAGRPARRELVDLPFQHRGQQA